MQPPYPPGPGAPPPGYYPHPGAYPGYGEPLVAGQTAKAWPWYVAFCIFMGVVYLCVVGGIVWFMSFAANDPTLSSDPAMSEANGQLIVYLVLCVPLMLMYFAAPFMPRKPWAWIYHAILIGISLTSCACWPVGIPLLLAWLKPDVKAMFYRDVGHMAQTF